MPVDEIVKGLGSLSTKVGWDTDRKVLMGLSTLDKEVIAQVYAATRLRPPNIKAAVKTVQDRFGGNKPEAEFLVGLTIRKKGGQ